MKRRYEPAKRTPAENLEHFTRAFVEVVLAIAEREAAKQEADASAKVEAS